MQITRERVSYEVVEIPKALNDFKGWEFSSGGTTGADFKVFARLFRAHIRKVLPVGAQLVNASTGHYFISGFIERAGKFVYFSISDVRYFPGAWCDNILVRTAKHERDYTGGGNCYTTLERFSSSVESLL